MNSELTLLPTAGLIVIKDYKLLLAFSANKKAWYLPGGKVDVGETALESIQREIKEELNIRLNPDGLKFYCHIRAQAYGEESHVIMEQDCFLYELNEKIKPSNEIADVAYFNREDYLQEPAQVIGVLQVFEQLKADKMI